MNPASNASVPILECRGIRRVLRSGDTSLTVLDDVNLAVAAGDSVAILGPSGSGKSTLLALMAGLDRPTAGRIILVGQDLGVLDEDGLARLRRNHVGFVFQNFQLLGNLTARENIVLPLELNGVKDARARTDVLLARVGLTERHHHYPTQLSGGEQQRVAIARALSAGPGILFADEPTGNLDAATGARVLDLLFDVQAEQGLTLVLVTHDERVAERASRRVRLEAGRVVDDSATVQG